MKYAKALIVAFLLIGGLMWLIKKGDLKRERNDRQSRSQALAEADVIHLSARYVLTQLEYAPPSELGGREMTALLKTRGWTVEAEKGNLPLAWCPAIRKGAFFRHGWVWVSDETGKTLKSIWYEPDLKADGKIEWSVDGTQLRVRADGWTRWLNLDLELN